MDYIFKLLSDTFNETALSLGLWEPLEARKDSGVDFESQIPEIPASSIVTQDTVDDWIHEQHIQSTFDSLKCRQKAISLARAQRSREQHIDYTLGCLEGRTKGPALVRRGAVRGRKNTRTTIRSNTSMRV